MLRLALQRAAGRVTPRQVRYDGSGAVVDGWAGALDRGRRNQGVDMAWGGVADRRLAGPRW